MTLNHFELTFCTLCYFNFATTLTNLFFVDKEPDLDNAFDKLLATFESDYQVSLHFGDQRRMLVTVKEGSLEQVNEAVHPAARRVVTNTLRGPINPSRLGMQSMVMLSWRGAVGLNR